MRTIKPVNIDLAFHTAQEARAATEAATFMLRGAAQHADVYIATAPTLVGSEGLFFVRTSFVVASPQEGRPPTTRHIQRNVDVAIAEPAKPSGAPVAPPSNTHVMLDLETLGTKPGCCVLSIGATVFGPDGMGEKFYDVMETETQVSAGLQVDPDTEAWWARQSPEARAAVFDRVKNPAAEVLTAFSTWVVSLGSGVRIWGNGADFDQPVLLAVYTRLGVKPGWSFYHHRCYRTLKSLDGSKITSRQGTAHNALDDAKSQALHAIEILNRLNLWKDV